MVAVDAEPPAMSRQEFSVAYNGAARSGDHSIDIQSLAPALLAFGRLLREANAEFNGRKAAAKILVVSDFEHKCFNINFELVLSFYSQIKSLLGSEDARSAKDILEWVGLCGTPPVVGTLGLLRYLQWKRGRKVESSRTYIDKDQNGLVEVRVEGDGNTVNVHNTVYNLSQNPRALRATRDAFLPLGHDGFDKVEIKDGDIVLEEIGMADVGNIVASCNVGIDEAKEVEPDVEVTPAWLSVYSPVYDLTAQNWRFRLGKEIIYADISQTIIAQRAIERGGALVEDAYQVQLEITTEIDHRGVKKSPRYKILEVIRFIPAIPPGRQASLFEGQPD